MQAYNQIIVYSHDKNKVLMCKRKKNLYKGFSIFAGGKVEQGESDINYAYRELYEETGISKDDINLHHLMDFTYYFHNCYVKVFAGKLNKEVAVSGDENELYWSDFFHDFFDMNLYGGEGNIVHMLEQVKLFEDEILGG